MIELDPRLENDSIEIGQMQICQVRLMNDRRWPWLLLIPNIENAVELHDLSEEQQALVAQDTAKAAKALKQVTDCMKINTGALGNVVRQLHLHIIARNEDDANWPGPVWGFEEREEYGEDEIEVLVETMQNTLIEQLD